jgi:dolichol-phosphate mannosyltransferase
MNGRYRRALMRSLIVIPTYNEAENIPELLNRIRAAAPDMDVLIVDDNSPDGTAELAQAVGSEVGNVDVSVRPRKDGLGNAYRHGFAIGIERNYDAMFEMDADLSHDPSALPRLAAAVERGAGLAIGSRYVPGGSIPNWAWHRRALSRYGNLYTRVALGLQARDLTSGYRCWEAETLKLIEYQTTTASGYLFQMELAYRTAQVGKSIVEVPISFTDRVRGTSKMSSAIVVEALATVTRWGVRDRVKGRKLRLR